MKKSALIQGLLLAVLVLFGLFSFNLALSSSAPAAPSKSFTTVDVEPTLQDWLENSGYAINVTTDETGIETFSAGYYKIAILAEFAAYAPENNLSWYFASNGELNTLLYGENTANDTTYFAAEETFGLCLGSPDGYFYTEAARNENGTDHTLVFENPNATGYIIAWEDLYNLGDTDFQDFVVGALESVDVGVCYYPRTLNLKSMGKWITAAIKLPKEYKAKDVDISSIALNGTVHADPRHYAIFDCGNLHLLVVKFDRAAVIERIKDLIEEAGSEGKFIRVSLTVTGNFLDGLPFQGANWIRIIHFNCCCHHSHCIRGSQCRFSCRPIDIHAIQLRLQRVCHASKHSLP